MEPGLHKNQYAGGESSGPKNTQNYNNLNYESNIEAEGHRRHQHKTACLNIQPSAHII
jgi:hypothetical protein